MATAALNYGSETAFSSASNLNSLTNGQAKSIGKIDNSSTKALTYALEIDISLASASVDSTGNVEIWFLESPDDAANSYSDGIDPTSSSNVASSLKNSRLLAVVLANANSQVVRWRGRLSDFGITMFPKYGAIVVKNNSGATFLGSGNAANFVPLKYDIA